MARVINRGLFPQTGQRVILMYHGISKRPNFNCITASQFQEQLSWLKEKYSVVPLSVLVENIMPPSSLNTSNLAAITFDDGYVNFTELALPVLQKYKLHATAFVPTGKVGYYNDWDKGMSGFHKMEIMSYSELRQLPREVVEIGSHGISHMPLDRLPYNEIEKEIVQSRVEIEQNIGKAVQFFAFPFGVYPFKYRFRLYDNKNYFLGGYKAACTTWWGRYNEMDDIHMLRRVGIWDSDSLDDFKDKLNGYYDWLEKKERVGRYFKIMKSFL
jgi:peptidoglycan/xylan/chitin deacetylase (PgdA/CDA1 family)